MLGGISWALSCLSSQIWIEQAFLFLARLAPRPGPWLGELSDLPLLSMGSHPLASEPGRGRSPSEREDDYKG